MKKSRKTTLFLLFFCKAPECSSTYGIQKIFVQNVKIIAKKFSKHFVKKTEKGLLFFLFLVIINSRVGSGYTNRYLVCTFFVEKLVFEGLFSQLSSIIRRLDTLLTDLKEA